MSGTTDESAWQVELQGLDDTALNSKLASLWMFVADLGACLEAFDSSTLEPLFDQHTRDDMQAQLVSVQETIDYVEDLLRQRGDLPDGGRYDEDHGFGWGGDRATPVGYQRPPPVAVGDSAVDPGPPPMDVPPAGRIHMQLPPPGPSDVPQWTSPPGLGDPTYRLCLGLGAALLPEDSWRRYHDDLFGPNRFALSNPYGASATPSEQGPSHESAQGDEPILPPMPGQPTDHLGPFVPAHGAPQAASTQPDETRPDLFARGLPAVLLASAARAIAGLAPGTGPVGTPAPAAPPGYGLRTPLPGLTSGPRSTPTETTPTTWDAIEESLLGWGEYCAWFVSGGAAQSVGGADAPAADTPVDAPAGPGQLLTARLGARLAAGAGARGASPLELDDSQAITLRAWAVPILDAPRALTPPAHDIVHDIPDLDLGARPSAQQAGRAATTTDQLVHRLVVDALGDLFDGLPFPLGDPKAAQLEAQDAAHAARELESRGVGVQRALELLRSVAQPVLGTAEPAPGAPAAPAGPPSLVGVEVVRMATTDDAEATYYADGTVVTRTKDKMITTTSDGWVFTEDVDGHIVRSRAAGPDGKGAQAPPPAPATVPAGPPGESTGWPSDPDLTESGHYDDGHGFGWSRLRTGPARHVAGAVLVAAGGALIALGATGSSPPAHPTRHPASSSSETTTTAAPPAAAAAGGACTGGEVELYNNWNGTIVANGAASPTISTGGKAYCLVELATYHWNNGQGALPAGTLALVGGTTGKHRTLGPYKAQATAGQAPNVNWVATIPVGPKPVVIDGTYTLRDSQPGTWSRDKSGGDGFVRVWGVQYVVPRSASSTTVATSTTGAASTATRPRHSTASVSKPNWGLVGGGGALAVFGVGALVFRRPRSATVTDEGDLQAPSDG
jgi:hypothetical protein